MENPGVFLRCRSAHRKTLVFCGSFVCKAAAPGFCFLYLFFSKWIYHRRKEAKHMKHNNLKKPAAVLTALALAAALLAI